MAQKKWITEIANEMQGTESEDRALLDIARAVRDNLYHEGIGIYLSATPKLLTSGDSFEGVGSVAFDRIKNLPWKDYKAIAKGEKDGIIPHVGAVDTIQFPLDQIWYNSLEMEKTDLASMKRGGIYRARLAATMTRTYAAAMDIEFFDLHIAAAAGKKGHIIEFPSQPGTPVGRRNYRKIADVGSELEQTITSYHHGISRNRFVLFVSPQFYTELIDETPGNTLAVERLVEWLQNESLVPGQISNFRIYRHPFLGTSVETVKGESKAIYDYTGIKAILALDGATAIIPTYFESVIMPNSNRGNYRFITRSKWGKGVIFGNLIRVFKEPSTKDNPLPFEQHLVENADYYNSRFAFNDKDEDMKITIPNTIEGLRENYRDSNELPAPDNPDEDHSPENWVQRTFKDASVTFYEDGKLEVNNLTCWRADEDWANNKDGIENHKNWFNFNEEFGGQKGRPMRFKRIVVWSTTDWRGYVYCVPVAWDKVNLKKLKVKAKSSLI